MRARQPVDGARQLPASRRGPVAAVRRPAKSPKHDAALHAAALGYTRPASYEELRAVLASGSVKLPRRLRQVAVFLWQHPSEVALGTTVSLAEQAGVQPSTLVRFAQHIGYAGFSDLQDLFKDFVKGGRTGRAGSIAPNGPAGRGRRNDRDLVAGFLGAAQDALARAAEDFDVTRFEAVAERMAAADIIYLVGSKRAFPVTTTMSIALSKLGIRNVLVDNVGSAAFDQIGWLAPRDVLLAVSFSPYNSITVDLAAVGRERNVPVVAITDSALSPLVPLAADWIEVVENDFAGFRSLGATIAMGTALVLATARRRERHHA